MKKWLKRIFINLSILFLIFAIVAAPFVTKGYKMYKQATEKVTIESKVNEIRAKDGYTEIEDISTNFTKALLHSEDRRFYYHYAVDPIALTRAVMVNLSAGKYLQGGSTITQQLAKNMYFSFEKKVERKVAELFVAFQLENKYTKDDILELYCNVVYFGENCYGIDSASWFFYDTSPSKLTAVQAEGLVDALKAPSVNNPSTEN